MKKQQTQTRKYHTLNQERNIVGYLHALTKRVYHSNGRLSDYIGYC